MTDPADDGLRMPLPLASMKIKKPKKKKKWFPLIFVLLSFLFMLVKCLFIMKNSISLSLWVLAFYIDRVLLDKTSMKRLTYYTIVKSLWFTGLFCAFYFWLWKFLLCFAWIVIFLILFFYIFVLISHNLQSFCILPTVFTLFALSTSLWFVKCFFWFQTLKTNDLPSFIFPVLKCRTLLFFIWMLII
jgi:hypothetical protein